MSIVKINVLTVPDEQREVLEKRFASRAGSVENSDGFEWFELLRPVEGTDQYLVYTRWATEADFEKWMATSMRGAHAGERGRRRAPQARRLRLVPVVLRGRPAGRPEERLIRASAGAPSPHGRCGARAAALPSPPPRASHRPCRARTAADCWSAR